jgi:hypothetical protein
MSMKSLSRRELLQSSGSALFCVLGRRILGATPPVLMNSLTINLVQTFPRKQILDVSPNGKNLCFDYWGNQTYPVEVIETSTWKTIFTRIFQTRAWSASFFADSKALLIESRINIGSKKSIPHLTRVDLKTGQSTEIHHSNSPYENGRAMALVEGIMLVEDIDWHSIDKCSLVLAEFPTYREITKVPFLVAPVDSQRSAPGDIRNVLSNDRSIYVYCYGSNLICRRTKDLMVLWTREIKLPNEVFMIQSPNASYVAIAVADSGFRDRQKEYRTLVYNGKTGAETAEFPICSIDGFALSPDGNLLAAVESKPDEKKQEYFLNVKLYDVRSGKILASVEHDRIKLQPHIATKAVCRLYFTSDGQYLISSGMNTKTWNIHSLE